MRRAFHIVVATGLLGGRYRLVEQLGAGGMSEVWRAHDEILDRQVAVKVLAAPRLADAASRERIRAEARAVARLSHPNIASVHDFGEAVDESGDQVPYVVMELVPGPTLAQRLAAGPVPTRTGLLIAAQVAAALAAAHARGLVHCDIKPDNVLLSPAGAKVVDFGIATLVGEPGRSAPDGKVWGTPAYVAPERLDGGDVAPASDVYALGLLLYRVLAGSLPWPAETITEVLEAHLLAEPAPLPELAGVPADVAALCRRCLSKQPADRPTAAEAARILARAGRWGVIGRAEDGDGAGELAAPAPAGQAPAASASVRAGAPGPRAAGARDRQRRRRAVVLVAVLAVLATGLFTGVWAAEDGPRAPDAIDPGAGSVPTSGPAGRDGPDPAPVDSDPSDTGAYAGTPLPPGATAGDPVVGTAAGGQAAGGQGGGLPGGGTVGPPPPRPVPPPPPAWPPPPPPPPEPTSPPSPVELTVPTPGGSVTCRCVGDTATLIGWDPLPDFTVTRVKPGPARRAGLVFDGADTDVRVVFRCRKGVPKPTIS